MWTIFDSEGRAVANSNLEPDNEDATARDERAVFHEEVISLDEIILDGNTIKRKPLIVLAATMDDFAATISVSCDDPTICEIPLLIGETHVIKPPGDWIIYGEAGVSTLVDFDRKLFRGKCLEVIF